MAQQTKERIVQVSAISGRFIAIYDTAQDASKGSGIISGNISKVLRGKAVQAGGFMFIKESKWKAMRGILD